MLDETSLNEPRGQDVLTIEKVETPARDDQKVKSKSTNNITNGDHVIVWRCTSGLRPVGSRVGDGVVERLKTSDPTGIGLARRPTASYPDTDRWIAQAIHQIRRVFATAALDQAARRHLINMILYDCIIPRRPLITVFVEGDAGTYTLPEKFI
ncbi:hypothetical protein EYF80_043928 [Liparis tanakae]|uniref:Uncharacterized protein n=1 Tax=Liparis tanakae TaxID=230148 RepID=A0A4Z2FX44_9TELE|nr:hypothetical protein EYF80_043928 [Liparis tanakae]